MPSKVIVVLEFMVLGIDTFWVPLRAHFNPRLTTRAKMNLNWAQNIFMPKNTNSIVLLETAGRVCPIGRVRESH